MKNLKFVWLLALAFPACSGVPSEGEEGIEVAQEELVNQWIGPVSEEAGRNIASCGQNDVGVGAARCVGSYCDDMSLFCSPLPSGVHSNAQAGSWSAFISEEGPNNVANCFGQSINQPTGVLDGIRATGKYADNVSIHCSPVTFPTSNYISACQWTPYFSEEQGTSSFSIAGLQGPFFAAGVRCSGSFCDNMSYLVCGNACISCSVDAQCGSGNHCSSGCCAAN